MSLFREGMALEVSRLLAKIRVERDLKIKNQIKENLFEIFEELDLEMEDYHFLLQDTQSNYQYYI